MAYCRTSSESDVYAYRSGKDFIIHLGDKMFINENINDFKKKLVELRLQGYKVPQSAFDRIDEETNTQVGVPEFISSQEKNFWDSFPLLLFDDLEVEHNDLITNLRRIAQDYWSQKKRTK